MRACYSKKMCGNSDDDDKKTTTTTPVQEENENVSHFPLAAGMLVYSQQPSGRSLKKVEIIRCSASWDGAQDEPLHKHASQPLPSQARQQRYASPAFI